MADAGTDKVLDLNDARILHRNPDGSVDMVFGERAADGVEPAQVVIKFSAREIAELPAIKHFVETTSGQAPTPQQTNPQIKLDADKNDGDTDDDDLPADVADIVMANPVDSELTAATIARLQEASTKATVADLQNLKLMETDFDTTPGILRFSFDRGTTPEDEAQFQKNVAAFKRHLNQTFEFSGLHPLSLDLTDGVFNPKVSDLTFTFSPEQAVLAQKIAERIVHQAAHPDARLNTLLHLFADHQADPARVEPVVMQENPSKTLHDSEALGHSTGLILAAPKIA